MESFEAPGDLTTKYVIGSPQKTIFYSASQYPCTYGATYTAELISKGNDLDNMEVDFDTPDFVIQAEFDGIMKI